MHPLKDHFRVASFFAGVGGIDLGFSLTRYCQIVYANEFDPYQLRPTTSTSRILPTVATFMP